jgi:hypothetical protein
MGRGLWSFRRDEGEEKFWKSGRGWILRGGRTRFGGMEKKTLRESLYYYYGALLISLLPSNFSLPITYLRINSRIGVIPLLIIPSG